MYPQKYEKNILNGTVKNVSRNNRTYSVANINKSPRELNRNGALANSTFTGQHQYYVLDRLQTTAFLLCWCLCHMHKNYFILLLKYFCTFNI